MIRFSRPIGIALCLLPVVLGADYTMRHWVKTERIAHTASSTLQEKGKPPSYYGPARAFDGRAATAWCEGKRGAGIGEWLEVRLRRPVLADGINVLNGYGRNLRLYLENNRVKDFELIVYTATPKGPGRFRLIGRFKDRACATYLGKRDCPRGRCCYGGGYYQGGARVLFPPINKKTQEEEGRLHCVAGLRLIVRSVYPGRLTDTCIAEVNFREPAGLFGPISEKLGMVRRRKGPVQLWRDPAMRAMLKRYRKCVR